MRLPQPQSPRTVRLVVDDAELGPIGVAAAKCRLSVASYARALIVASCDHPEWAKVILATAARLQAESPPDRPRPGRPRKEK